MPEPWNLPEREATPEKVSLSRRRWLKALGLGSLALVATGGVVWWKCFRPGTDEEVLRSNPFVEPAKDRYPAERNARFVEVDRPLSDEAEVARYTNFYEFTSLKSVWRNVGDFQPVPWTIEVTGLVA